LERIARFCASQGAVTFAISCREFGVDPAAEIEDPFLAHQLRIGLTDAIGRFELKVADESKDDEDEAVVPTIPLAEKHRAHQEQAKERMAQIGMTW
jgi:hypothetical protein